MRRISRFHTLSFFSRLGIVRGPSEFSVKDVNQILLGVGWSADCSNTFLPSVTTTLIYGKAIPVQSESEYGTSYNGIRIGSSSQLFSRFTLSGSAGLTATQYDSGSFFGEIRNDSKVDLSIGMKCVQRFLYSATAKLCL